MTTGLQIVKNVTTEEKEDRNGRIRTSTKTEWIVVDKATTDVIGTFRTLRMARAFVAEADAK